MKTLFIILLIYIAFKYLARLFTPFLMKKMAEKMQQKAEQQFGGNKSQPIVKEGETIIDKNPQKNQQSSNDVGEYVDFEEVD
ncbi:MULTISPECIES: DUF4834 family protein [Tenacibaculum]|uniref:DUF4834 family protein n=1 Tax=Tenacibaculum TaxID=104267 RepID=UPI001F0B4104|nr:MULTISPECIES: DUF4834 family protein [Tenacibaculum]MCH3882439.1 DUF4834 family protein [Tenacibaculum aquimarinum]MCH3885766.1 DUF4834 family protein [Tenacibaculum aquimarinum]MDO6600079.1 DUF4834 family protein [Tenacibaculum sp. 1_MG-2023]